MDIRQAFLKMISSFPGGWDGLPAAMGLTRAALQNRVYSIKGQSVSIDQALLMQTLTGQTAFAEAVAELSGGTFVRLPDVDELDNAELINKFNELYKALGKLSEQFSEYTADGVIDSREKSNLKSTGNQIHSALQNMLACTFRLYSQDETRVQDK